MALLRLVAFSLALIGFAHADVPANIKRALAARDFATAVSWLETNAASGDPDAAFELGKLYRLGQGVEADPDRAVTLFQSAADGGNADAHYLLGKHFERSGDTELARHHMQQAAAAEHRRAQRWLAAASPAAQTPDTSADLSRLIASGSKPQGTWTPAQVNSSNKFGAAPLTTAVTANSPDWTRYLLEHGADINHADKLGNTALHYAASAGVRELVNVLLQAGADPNIGSAQGLTPLHLAVSAGHLEVVTALLAAGADRTLPDAEGWTPQALAARSNNNRMRSTLGVRQDGEAERLQRLNSQADELTLLARAAQRGDLPLLQSLIDSGVDINQQSADGQTALTRAISAGQPEAVSLLLQHNANVELAVGGQSPLHLAVANAHADITAALLRKPHVINLTDPDGDTALSLAVRAKCTPCVALLLDAGANTRLSGSKGETALIAALRTAQPETARLIISATTETDQRDNAGRTALWWACRQGYQELAVQLITQGAKPIADEQQVNPLHVAAQENNIALINLLAARTDLNARTDSGNTPLILAASYEADAAVSRLIQADVDIELRNNVGDTALIAATRSGEIIIARVLLEAGANPNLHNDRFESARSIIEERQDAEWNTLLAESGSGLLTLFD